MSQKIPTIAIVGLGKLGIPFMATAASRGFSCIGIDVASSIIKGLKQKTFHSSEPRLMQLLNKYQHNYEVTTDYKAIRKADISFIIVPTPSKENGAFSNKYVESALTVISKQIKNTASYHVVALVSTVVPQSGKHFIKIMERITTKRIGDAIGYCYNPSFIALGSVINNLLTPDMVLIGESDTQAGKLVAAFHKQLTLNQPPIAHLNIIDAEITKLALNTYITTKISYANMIAEICEKTPGADAQQVTNALGLDSRVGKKYLQGSTPYGGPCFPRDNRCLQAYGKKIHVSLPIASATETINHRQVPLISKQLEKIIPNRATVGIIGIAYKADTNVCDEASGIYLAKHLVNKHISVMVYDSLALDNARFILGKHVSYTDNLNSLVKRAEVFIITTPLKKQAKLLLNLLTNKKERKIIIYDLWNQLSHEKIPFGITYLVRGKNIGPTKIY